MAAQTIYAKTAAFHVPAFPPAFPFLSASAADLVVVDASGFAVAARADAVVAMAIDLTGVIGSVERLARITVGLSEVTGIDPRPGMRLLGVPAIGNPQQRGVRQNLVALIDGGQYVAFIGARTAAGHSFNAVAPFSAAGDQTAVVTVYLTSDPPFQILTDSGNPLTAA